MHVRLTQVHAMTAVVIVYCIVRNRPSRSRYACPTVVTVCRQSRALTHYHYIPLANTVLVWKTKHIYVVIME